MEVSLVDLYVGTEVEVRTRYLGTWAPGFEVVWIVDGQVGVRRRSDRVLLPVTMRFEDVRVSSTP
jgi:hypothetical protein